jgi:hypothetical protein
MVDLRISLRENKGLSSIIWPVGLRKIPSFPDCFDEYLRDLYWMRGWTCVVNWVSDVGFVVGGVEVDAIPTSTQNQITSVSKSPEKQRG